MRCKISIYLSIFLLVCSCNSRQKEISKVVHEWMGKEILLPNAITYKVMGRDTICSELWNRPYKVFIYVDSIGCVSCRLGLSQWKERIDSCKQEYPDLGFLFVIQSSNYKKFESELRFAQLDYPMIYDPHNEFDKLNKFPIEPYRTFLLDKDNKVKLIGSPIHNPAMWKLYKMALVENSN